MQTPTSSRTWKTLLAFAILYLVWGSTFLAIRIGVHEVPPLVFASLRFLAAGVILYAWMRAHGEPSPTLPQWKSILLLALLIFALDYGLLFWAEQRVPSGLAAVLMATIPLLMALAEVVFLRTQTLTLRLASALILGFAGVAILMLTPAALGTAPLGTPGIDRPGAIALIVASVCWTTASILSKRLPLPPSKVMSSAAQMLAGGVLLTLAAVASGEFRDFHPQAISHAAWGALVYLIVAGSLIGFTAYVWLIHHESPTRVATYAYVNPVVAVILGYFVAHEPLGPRTILGALLILASVILITTTQNKPLPKP